MWIFIWIVISCFIIGMSLWNLVILRQQKTAWAAFAKKNNLKYMSRKFMEPAVVQGMIGNYRLSLFSDTQQTDDVRGERHVSVIEIEMGAGMKTGAALGTQEMRAFIDGLSFPVAVKPIHPKWQESFIAKTRDTALLTEYLTQPRLDAMMDLFNMNKVSALYFFDEYDCVLHLETVDPLRDSEKLTRIVERIMVNVRKLALDTQRANPTIDAKAAEEARAAAQAAEPIPVIPSSGMPELPAPPEAAMLPPPDDTPPA